MYHMSQQLTTFIFKYTTWAAKPYVIIFALHLMTRINVYKSKNVQHYNKWKQK